MSKQRQKILAGMILSAVIIACAAGFLLYQNHQKQAVYQGKLKMADKYLQALDYKKAEAVYLEAINIQPKEEKAYTKLADAYVKQGEYKKAGKMLEKGKKQTGSNVFDREIEKLAQKAEAGGAAAQYKPYYDLCMEYRDKYGEGGYKTNEDSTESYSVVNLTGLCVVRLIDFNREGTKELLLGYRKEADESSYNPYVYEVWSLKDGQAVNVLPATEASHGQDVGSWIEIASKEEIPYLVVDHAADMASYIKYENGKFTTAYSYEMVFPQSGDDFLYLVNGESFTSYEEAMAVMEEEFPERAEFESNFSGFTYETGTDAFRIHFYYIPAAYAEAVLEDTAQTLEELQKTDL